MLKIPYFFASLILVNVYCAVSTFKNQHIPLRIVADEKLIDLYPPNETGKFKHLHTFFLTIQNLVRGKELIAPVSNWAKDIRQDGLGIEFFVLEIGAFRVRRQNYRIADYRILPPDYTIKTYHKRAFKKPIEFHYNSKAKLYILIPGDIVKIVAVEKS